MRILMNFFSSILDILHLAYWSCVHFDIHCTYILYILMYALSPTLACVVSFLSLYTCFLYKCMQSFISVSH